MLSQKHFVFSFLVLTSVLNSMHCSSQHELSSKSVADSLLVAVGRLDTGEVDRLTNVLSELNRAKKMQLSADALEAAKICREHLIRYDIAKQKLDYESMFLSLTEIRKVIDSTKILDSIIGNLNRIISIDGRLRRSIESHNHELSVILADSLITVDSTNPVAFKALRESGPVLNNLSLAMKSLNGIFQRSGTGEITLIGKVNDSGKSELDIEGAVYLLQNSVRYAKAAKDLDQYCTKSLEIERMAAGTRNILSYFVTVALLETGKTEMAVYSQCFIFAYSQMTESVSNPFLDPAEVWEVISPTINEITEICSAYEKRRKKLMAALMQSRSDDLSLVIDQVNRFCVSIDKMKMTVTNPRGSLVDYGRDNRDQLTEISDIIDQIRYSMPSEGQIKSEVIQFYNAFVGYKLFEFPETTPELINKYL